MSRFLDEEPAFILGCGFLSGGLRMNWLSGNLLFWVAAGMLVAGLEWRVLHGILVLW